LASLRASTRAIADLAFGDSLQTLGPPEAGGRHLALLTAETLQLDLDDPAQRQFGDYELLEQIGEGGMGVVYRARQRSLDRDVALKLLAAGPWASREFVERFRREAQHAARMQHPNIVAIHEVGSAEELHFFSMRLVRGGSLAAMLKTEGMLAPVRAAQVLRTVAEAVDYAHRLGVLHLDLKPANVLLDENGIPHVADFGLARQLDSALADGDDEVSGTPSYMAPEQASPRMARISPATDIWGLGAILYELVTGQPPFLGKSPHETLRLVVEGSLRNPRKIVPALSRDLEAIILKCLARETSDRYVTGRALADDLGRLIEGRAVRARPLSAPQRILRWARREPKLALTAAAGLAALAIGLVATTQESQRAESNADLATASAALANERLWQARIDQAAAAVNNGHGYDALPGLAATIKEREAQGLDAKEDRIRIAAVERSAPRLIDIIATGSSIYGIALSPDGKSVAVATQDEKLHLFDSATGKERWQVSFHGATHFWNDSPDPWILLDALRFSADGRYIVGRGHIGVLVLGYISGLRRSAVRCGRWQAHAAAGVGVREFSRRHLQPGRRLCGRAQRRPARRTGAHFRLATARRRASVQQIQSSVARHDECAPRSDGPRHDAEHPRSSHLRGTPCAEVRADRPRDDLGFQSGRRFGFARPSRRQDRTRRLRQRPGRNGYAKPDRPDRSNCLQSGWPLVRRRGRQRRGAGLGQPDARAGRAFDASECDVGAASRLPVCRRRGAHGDCLDRSRYGAFGTCPMTYRRLFA
jgi:hypothetical protein